MKRLRWRVAKRWFATADSHHLVVVLAGVSSRARSDLAAQRQDRAWGVRRVGAICVEFLHELGVFTPLPFCREAETLER